jgi:DnaK suppressor protein
MPQKRSSKSMSARGTRAVRSRARSVKKASAARAVSAPAPRAGKGGLGSLEKYTRLLLDERQRLRQELSEMEEQQVKTHEEKPVADVGGGYDEDLVDVASEAFEREKGLALESSVQGVLAMVEDALRRIRAGTYGVCAGCGQPIDANRLSAIPYARLCIKCKEREERLRSAVR